MEKKELYMIGKSHIDPVWFWNWEEGMQEVKATYASALERMKEFEDFKFTSTSTLFFEWIEGILPEMFEEIKQRVAEGRWEITGGWFLEPDCILPCGEAFVRQGLYAQRYLKSRFGRLCTIDQCGQLRTQPCPSSNPEKKRYGCLCVHEAQAGHPGFCLGRSRR
ncbi:MAG: hypothetical protein ACLUOI_09990 [Eisenbergiella sp.]